MSKIHVLENNNGKYRVVLHFNVPAGSNSAGKTWKDCALSSGDGVTTILPEGTGTGQIATAEKASIESGDVLEVVDNILLESGGASSASVDAMADTIINNKKALLQQKYKYYGYTQEE